MLDKAIDKANLELALSENNDRMKKFVSDRAQKINIAQKTVNSELDYFNATNIANGTSKTLSKGIISLTNFNTIIKNNIEVINESYATLTAGKVYNIKANMMTTATTARYLYITTDEGVIIASGCSGAANYNPMIIDVIYSPTKNENIGLSLGSSTAVVLDTCYFTIQEVNRQIVIDPVEYVNTQRGIEDTPVGHIMSHMGNTTPKHYLICDGAEYNIADYPYLAEHILNEFGSYNYFGGNGELTFCVPDLRGEFLRGTGTATRDTGSGDSVGVHQDGTEHLGIYLSGTPRFGARLTGKNSIYDSDLSSNYDKKIKDSDGYYSIDYTTTKTVANNDIAGTFTSRPTNTSVLYCIKYEPTYFYADTVQNNDPELEQIISQLGLILDDINGEVI